MCRNAADLTHHLLPLSSTKYGGKKQFHLGTEVFILVQNSYHHLPPNTPNARKSQKHKKPTILSEMEGAKNSLKNNGDNQDLTQQKQAPHKIVHWPQNISIPGWNVPAPSQSPPTIPSPLQGRCSERCYHGHHMPPPLAGWNMSANPVLISGTHLGNNSPLICPAKGFIALD